MSLYEGKIFPYLVNRVCSSEQVMSLKAKVIPLATGKVLEIGMGTGANLSLYNKNRVEFIWGLEPSAGMRKQACSNVEKSAVEVKWLDLPGEKIPLENESVDTIVLTFTLCSIPDWKLALQQMHRVLKPEGKLLFCEHGRAPEVNVQKWQDRLNPFWKKIGGGCHLNRPIESCLKETGFQFDDLQKMYMASAPRIVGYMYYGQASLQHF
ncbi:MAG: class I SAM-dependent methyltransferase [SAR324 cluster bacterium]|nr:class I SAM-dependent methyltransferase [SAR324 cluster bacterium]